MKACRLPLDFDAARLAAEVAQFEDAAWVPHYNEEQHRGEWSGVALRSILGMPGQIYPGIAPHAVFDDTPVLKQCCYLQGVLRAFQCPVNAARLLKLGPGGAILEHSDDGVGWDNGFARIHIPVTTAPEVEFFLAGEVVNMAAGETWYLDLSLPHSCENRSATARIHMVLECEVNDWLAGMIEQEP